MHPLKTIRYRDECELFKAKLNKNPFLTEAELYVCNPCGDSPRVYEDVATSNFISNDLEYISTKWIYQ